MELTGEAVVVIGATGRVGQSLAVSLWTRGASVALLARNADALQATKTACLQARQGTEPVAILIADASDKEELGRAIQNAVKSLGDVSMVVHVIGPQPSRNEQRVGFPNATLSWTRTLQLNLELASHVALVSCPLLAAHNRPPRNSSLFLFGSGLIKWISSPNQTPWLAAKVAINSLARGLFYQFRPQRVRVCCLNPGPLESMPPSELADAIVHSQRCPAPSCVSAIELNTLTSPKPSKRPPASSAPLPHVALVAGGSRGIGRAIAVALAANGMHVAVLGTNPEAVQQAVALCEAPKRGQVLGVTADVADSAAVARAVEQVMVRWGRISVMVYSAGVNRRRPALLYDAKTEDFKGPDPKVWGNLVDVNIKGATNVTAHCLPHMARHVVNFPETGAPALIYVSSAWVRQKGQAGQSTYVASKKAINAFADGLFLDLRNTGIKVSCLNVGLVATELGSRARSDGVKVIPPTEQIQPDHVARTTLYVLKSKAIISEVDLETMTPEIPEFDRVGQDARKSKL